MLVLALKLDAGHTDNGNPRRGWLIMDAGTGGVVNFVDEGYEGSAALHRAYPAAVEVNGSVKTTPAEYRDLLRGPARSRR